MRPGALCTTRRGRDWIDTGTCARTHMPAPAHRHAAPRRHAAGPAKPAPLTTREREVLVALDVDGMTDRTERAMFLAQVAHESQGFVHRRENLHYSAARLLAVFPAHFADLADAQAVVAAGTDAVAERIYGGRIGNVHPGDGARFIGRGYIQLTGRDNYTAAEAALHLDLVNHPERAEVPANAARIALWYWRANGIGPAARHGDVRAVTRAINGGTIGLADRTHRFHHYLGALPREAPPVVMPLP